MIMKKICFAFLIFVLCAGHDMFLKLDTYILPPNTAANIELFNGTFELSENTIDRNRMADVSLVGNGQRLVVDTAMWKEKDGVTILNFNTGAAGTWVAGVSTLPRNIEMNAEDFNGYLEHDGILDMLQWRKENDALGKAAVEKYSKHVKTIFQVGEKRTADWQKNLGYQIEFIPLNNPYDMHIGDALSVELLWQGQPLRNQLVYVGSDAKQQGHAHDHDHEEGADHHHHGEGIMQMRTDESGMLSFKVTDNGRWYLRTIHLVPSEETGLTHESNWATLTFQVGHDHSHAVAEHSHGEDGHSHGADGHTHAEDGHSHEDGDHHHHADEDTIGVPPYAYWIGSFLIIAGLFFWFNRQENTDLE